MVVLVAPAAEACKGGHDQHGAEREAEREFGGGQHDDGEEEGEGQDEEGEAAAQKGRKVGQLRAARHLVAAQGMTAFKGTGGVWSTVKVRLML